MTIVWDGITLASTLKSEHVAYRHKLADAARDYHWERVLAILEESPELVNVTRPGGKALYTPLHQAAHGNAPTEVITQLLVHGAWRSLPNADGEHPVDVARKMGHGQLVSLLTPVYGYDISASELAALQRNLHVVILERAKDLVEEHQLRLPELSPLLEYFTDRMWFAIPGMYGGFDIWFEVQEGLTLMTDSWSRVVGGSGQRHKVTADGYELVDEGFV